LEQLNGDLSADQAHGETPPPLGCDPEVVKTRADAICTGPRSKVEKIRREKQENILSDPVLHYLNFLIHAPITITPIASISA
jgi:hypothetical protein